MRRFAFVIPVWLLAVAGFGCSSPTPAPDAAADRSVVSMGGEGAAAAKVSPPKIISDQPVFDFGKIEAKETVEHVFVVKNAGGSDLHIKGVQKT